MFPRVLLILSIFLSVLFVHETVIAFLPAPYNFFPLMFLVALPLTHRSSVLIGAGVLAIFGLSISLFGASTHVGIGYIFAAAIVGITASRFFASRSPLAYLGLCVGAAFGYTLGAPYPIVAFILALTAGLLGGALAVWGSSLRHMFLPL